MSYILVGSTLVDFLSGRWSSWSTQKVDSSTQGMALKK